MRERKAALVEYYMKNCGYGKPTSVLLYQLVHSKQLSSDMLAWCARRGGAWGAAGGAAGGGGGGHGWPGGPVRGQGASRDDPFPSLYSVLATPAGARSWG